MQATVPSKHATAVRAGSASALPVKNRAETAPPKPEEYNPYLASRHEWDDRNGDLDARRKQSDLIALICAAVALLMAPASIVVMLRSPKIIVVPINSSGQALGSGVSGQSLMVTERMKQSNLSEWISNLRLVTSDGISQRSAIEKVYAMISSGSSAQAFVSDFYRAEPPHTRAQSQTVHIEVNTILPTSERTYEVEWLETTRDLQGKVLVQQRWKGAFTFVVSSSPPNDERLARLNPIGLYVTQSSWAKVI